MKKIIIAILALGVFALFPGKASAQELPDQDVARFLNFSIPSASAQSGGGSESSTTSSPTPTPTPTAAPTIAPGVEFPDELLDTGAADMAIIGIGAGIFLLLASLYLAL